MYEGLLRLLLYSLSVVHISCYNGLDVNTTDLTPAGADNCSKLSLPEGCSCKSLAATRIYCKAKSSKIFPQFNQLHLHVESLRVEGMNATEFKGGQFFGWELRKLILRRNKIQVIDDLAFWGLEYQLDVLDLSKNQLLMVPSNALRAMRALRVLKLSQNRINYLRSREFKPLINLRVLHLDRNPIYYISLYAFVGSNLYVLKMDGVRLPQPKSRNGEPTRRMDNIPTHDFQHLRVLSLSNASISTIPDGFFKRFHSLRYLNLNHNKIRKIKIKAFEGIGDTLSILKMSMNKLEIIPKAAFLGFKRLRKLDLSRNQLNKMTQKSFFGMYSLIKLDLRYNNIEIVRPKALYGLQQLEDLDLRHNIISWLTKQAISWSNVEDFKVHLSDNAWSCDCHIRWLRREADKNTSVVDLDLLRCAYPYYHRGEMLLHLKPEEFFCEYEEEEDGEEVAEESDVNHEEVEGEIEELENELDNAGQEIIENEGETLNVTEKVEETTMKMIQFI